MNDYMQLNKSRAVLMKGLIPYKLGIVTSTKISNSRENNRERKREGGRERRKEEGRKGEIG